MSNRLPDVWRPRGLKYKKLNPGVDLPAWFVEGIKAVDSKLYFVYHPFRVQYDDIMNQYSGSLEDPRWAICAQGADEIWGMPLMMPDEDRPIPEHRWHCWRLCDNGWAHIFEVKSKDPEYLDILLNRLHLQATITDKYGPKAYIRYLREERELMAEREQERKDFMLDETHKENKWLLNKAMDNYMSGKTAPTRPQKETIVSYPGQKRFRKLSRDLTDEEGGLILPDELKEQ
jgi:hypothetical protein